jgi:hypothetical protein
MMIATDDASETAPGPTGTLTIECSPGPVDAGGTLTLAASVTTEPPADLRDGTLVLRDAAGATLCTAAFTEFDGLTSGTGPFTVPAPTAPGRYAWVATAPLDEDGEAVLEAAFEVEVRAHAMSLLVWDVPATVVAGERFRFKVGSKCSSGCALGGAAVEIHDADGATLATEALSAEPWPKTALYAAEVEVEAPAAAGLFRWQAREAASDAAPAHAEGVAAFTVRVVPQPDFMVTVEAIDRQKRTPVRGAQVVMHPYRAVTDAQGLAEVRVPKGDYTMFVSGPRCFPYRVPITVEGDMRTTTELVVEPPIERN